MKAIWNGQVIAESDKTLDVAGYSYFPRDSVRMDLLHKTERTVSDRACPNGVQFYDVKDDHKRSERGAWSYEATRHEGYKPIDHFMGFWGDVKIVP